MKEFQSFLVFLRSIKQFIPNLSNIGEPIFILIKQNNKITKFAFDNAVSNAFAKNKDAFSKKLGLCLPNSEFILSMNASETPVESTRSQEIKGNVKMVSFFSKKICKCQWMYCTKDREFLALC